MNAVILTVVVLFYGGQNVTTTQITNEHTSMDRCEAARKTTLEAFAKTEEGKVVAATCTVK